MAKGCLVSADFPYEATQQQRPQGAQERADMDPTALYWPLRFDPYLCVVCFVSQQ